MPEIDIKLLVYHSNKFNYRRLSRLSLPLGTHERKLAKRIDIWLGHLTSK